MPWTGGLPGGSVVKNLPANAGDARDTCSCVRSLGWEDPLEKEMATHCSILAWGIPWTEEIWQAIVHGVAKSQTWLSNRAHRGGRWGGMGKENGGLLCNGDRVSVKKVKNPGDARWWELHNNVNALSATELCSKLWSKRCILYYVTFAAINRYFLKRKKISRSLWWMVSRSL